jgi:hypothetical protein
MFKSKVQQQLRRAADRWRWYLPSRRGQRFQFRRAAVDAASSLAFDSSHFDVTLVVQWNRG